MNWMPAAIDYDKDVASFRHYQGITRIPLVIECIVRWGKISDEFTSDRETEDEEIIVEEAYDEWEDDLRVLRRN